MQKRRWMITMIFVLMSLGYCAAQAFLALDVTRITGFKRIKYYVGDEICFKDGNSNKRYKGTIVGIRDSMLLFASKEVNVKDIQVIYRDNANFVTKALGGLCFWFGVGFVGLDTFNNITNQRSPVVNEEAVVEGASFVAAGVIFKQMMKHRYKIGKRRTVKIIDLSL